MTATRLARRLAVPVLLAVLFHGVGVAHGAPAPGSVPPVGARTASDSLTSVLVRYLSHRKLATTIPVAVRLCSAIGGPDLVTTLQRHMEAMTVVTVDTTNACARQPAPHAPDPLVPVVLVRSVTFRADTAIVAASVWHGAALRIDETATLRGPRWGVLGLTFHTAVHSDRVPRDN
jgi:hypothetical protein